jgi:hypothetical protein
MGERNWEKNGEALELETYSDDISHSLASHTFLERMEGA